MSRSPIFILLSLSLSGLALWACTPSAPQFTSAPLISRPVEQTGEGTKKRVTVTFNKKAILSQEFLAGLDLQHSTIPDNEGSFVQAKTFPLTVGRFRIFDGRLELIADERANFESSANHPNERLISYPILKETDSELTVVSGDSTSLLEQATQLTLDRILPKGASNHGVSSASQAWVRDFQFDSNDNTILQEMTLELRNGNTLEYAVYFFPRSRLAISNGFRVITDNGDKALLDRFRFLWSEPQKEGARTIRHATHYDFEESRTIDWYVTRTLPPELLTAVKNGVEGWNRYFTELPGIKRPVMRFMGYLPVSIAFGDPRYNVIEWDTVEKSGAAQSSIAADPATGRVSHSLIYLPSGWLSAGKKYFDGAFSTEAPKADPQALGATSLLCAHSMTDARAFLDANAALSSTSTGPIPNLAIQLLQGVLMHEVGHTLGLAHNFRASLEYDPALPDAVGTTSVMDYFDYRIWARIFNGVQDASGPKLAYDFQILSAIYDHDSKKNEAWLPVCSDQEAGRMKGRIDPLCNRYDEGHDPTAALTIAEKLWFSEKADGSTLAEIIRGIPARILPDSEITSLKTTPETWSRLRDFKRAVLGTITYYSIFHPASLRNGSNSAIRMLLAADDASLRAEKYDPIEMRDRSWRNIQTLLQIEKIPETLKATLKATTEEFYSRYSNTKIGSLTKTAALTELSNFESDAETFVSDVLSGMRSETIGKLKRDPDVPYYLGPGLKTSDGKLEVVDYEAQIVQLLLTYALNPKTDSELRMAAVKSLATFSGRPQGEDAIENLKAELRSERVQAASNDDREEIESMLGELNHQR